jgi:hypothetical protein
MSVVILKACNSTDTPARVVIYTNVPELKRLLDEAKTSSLKSMLAALTAKHLPPQP